MQSEVGSEPVDGLYAYLVISSLMNLATWVLLLLPNLLQQHGWSAQEIGWAVGAFFLVNLTALILAGQISDQIGGVQTALLGVTLGIVAGVLYLLSSFWIWMIFPARVLHGGAAGMIGTGALIQLTRSVPTRLKGRVIGYFGLPGFVMIGVGPLLSEWLTYRWGFEGAFVLVLLAFLATGALLLRLPRELVMSFRKRVPFLVILRASFPRLLTILMFSVLFGLCFSSWNGFLAPTVRDIGEGAVSGFGSGYAVGAVISRLGFSRSLDSHFRRLLAISFLLPYALCVMLIPFSETGWQLLALGFVCGAGHGIYYPSLSSLAAERFHPLYPGQGMSLYISASALGLFFGPPLWGFLADQFGFTVIFIGAGLLLGLGTILFVASESRDPNRAAGHP